MAAYKEPTGTRRWNIPRAAITALKSPWKKQLTDRAEVIHGPIHTLNGCAHSAIGAAAAILVVGTTILAQNSAEVRAPRNQGSGVGADGCKYRRGPIEKTGL